MTRSRRPLVPGSLPMIGRECNTSPFFTAAIYRSLDLPHPERLPNESDRDFLIRRLEGIKWISRHWSLTRLETLPAELFEVAAMQILHAAADYCQDRVAERSFRAGTFYPPRGTP